MASGGGESGEFGLQIAPLLDVLFVLLLFFMVTAGTKEREAELRTRLPSSGPSRGETPQTPINLAIGADGSLYWNDSPLQVSDKTMPELVGRLKNIVEKFSDQPVIILPDAQTQHQDIVNVLSACNEAEVKNLAFGTN